MELQISELPSPVFRTAPLALILCCNRKCPRFSNQLMGKRLFSGDLTPLPDNLRCRRSDGRQWRCPQPVKSGLSFCEHHYQQVRRNQGNIKNANPKKKLLRAESPLAKKRRRRPLIKESQPPPAKTKSSEKMEEVDVVRKASDLKEDKDPSLHDQSFHQQPDGRQCHCSMRRHRLAAEQIPPMKHSRRKWLKGETRNRESIWKNELELGECGTESAEPTVMRKLPIPDKIRCRRSDGRKWRCTHPAIPGLSFCEYHQMRYIETYRQRTGVRAAEPRRRSKLRLIGEELAESLMRMEQNEECLKSPELTISGLNSCVENLLCYKVDNSQNREPKQKKKNVKAIEPFISKKTHFLTLQNPLQCRRSNGRKWRCPHLAIPSVGFCQYHFVQRCKQGKKKNSKSDLVIKRKQGKRLKLRLRGELPAEEMARMSQEERNARMEVSQLEITKDLPNGMMAILPVSAFGLVDASPRICRKIGSEYGYFLGRCFRSKNAELVPLVPLSRV